MKKTITFLFLAAAMVLTLTACDGDSESTGENRTTGESTATVKSETAESTTVETTAADKSETAEAKPVSTEQTEERIIEYYEGGVNFADYYGEYINDATSEVIVIDGSGVHYNGSTMAIESVGGDRAILCGSDAVFILDKTEIATNLSHIEDDSYLDAFKKKTAETTATPASEAPIEITTASDNGGNTWSASPGVYVGENPSDTFELIEASDGQYMLINLWIDSQIYYVDGKRIPGEVGKCNEMSATFYASEGETTEIVTYYGCEGTICFADDGSIQLMLKLEEEVFNGKFVRQ